MLIRLLNNRLLIDQTDSLQPYQTNQLKFWGFSSVSNRPSSLSNQSNAPQDILPRIIEFFRSEGVEYFLANDCQSLVAQLNLFLEKVGTIRKLVSDFKNGKVEAQSFNSFEQFLKQNIR